MFAIELIDDTSRFDGLSDEWRALARAGAGHNVFLTWEWLRTWWRHLSEGRRLSLFAVRDGAELVAVLPLCARRDGLGRLAPALELLGTGMVGSDYLDAIVKPGCEDGALAAFSGALARTPLSLRGVERGDTHLARLLARLAERGFRVSSERSEVCPFLPLAGLTFESYLASLGSKHRYGFRKKLRDLTNEHGLDWKIVAGDEERREALFALFDFHDVRWNPQGGSDAFTGAAIRAFHDEISALALAQGWLRLLVLRLAGRPAAVVYGFRLGRKFFFYQMGWDARYAPQSLGLLMTGLAIRGALEEGAAEFDFLHGSEPYKFHWTRETRELARLDAYPPSALGLLRRGADQGLREARRTARRVLPEAWTDAIVSARRGGIWRALRAASLR